MRVGYPSWSVDISNDWSVTEHPDCLTLELSDQGALQASSARKRSGAATDEDLFFSLNERGSWGPYQRAAFGEFEGIVYEYQEGDTSWVRWFLKQGSTLLFVTYNGTHEAAAQERDNVYKVLCSLRAEATNGV